MKRSSKTQSPLSRERIIHAALGIADADGLGSLSIRRLADALGVTPMAVYHYFRNKQEIVEGFFDIAVGSFEPDRPAPADWEEWTVAAFLGMRSTFRAHPAVVSLIGTWGLAGENSMMGMEVVLDVLKEAGFSDEAAVHAFYTLISLTAGYAAIDGATRRQRSDAEVEEAEEWRRQQRLRFESLPRPRFPRLVELSSELSDFWTDDGFERCLRGVVAGLRHHAT